MSEISETSTVAEGKITQKISISHSSSNGEETSDAKDDANSIEIKLLNDAPSPANEGTDWARQSIRASSVVGRRNHEAWLKVNQILVLGAVELGKKQAAAIRTRSEQALTGWQELASAMSIIHMLETYPRRPVDTFLAALDERGKFAFATIDLVGQAMAPVAERLSSAHLEFSQHS